MIGSTVGVWKVERSLGRGAFGTVWAARGADGEAVVIKVLIPAISRDPAIRMRLKQTWAELHQIDHPNIVQIRDVIERDADLCLVMEQVAGQTVEKLLSTGPLEPEEVLDMGRGVASALAAAHARGVIHRDITPANIYLGEGGVKISNFGIALAVQEAGMMEDGFLPGTPLYMAPELFEGKPATPAIDVYALGLVLHRSLTRNPSFRAPERSPGSRRVFIPEIPDIRRLCPGVGNRLADGIRTALQRDPLSRPPNGSAMLQRLLEPGSTFEVGENARPASASLPPQDLPFAPPRRPSLPPADLPPESRTAAFRSIPPPEPAPEAAGPAPAPAAAVAVPETAPALSVPPVVVPVVVPAPVAAPATPAAPAAAEPAVAPAAAAPAAT
jgi:eukaryotic-like serine/threonine-protein kinase